MYVNYFDRYVKIDEELPTVGILLCHRKNDVLVELTLPQGANIFASQYQLYLPSKEELKAQIEKVGAEFETQRRIKIGEKLRTKGEQVKTKKKKSTRK